MEELLKIIDHIGDHIEDILDDAEERIDFSVIQEERTVIIRITDADSCAGSYLIRKFVELYHERVDIKREVTDSGTLIILTISLSGGNNLNSLQDQADTDHLNLCSMNSLQTGQTLERILTLERLPLPKQMKDIQLKLREIWVNKLISVLEENLENTEFNVAMLCQLLGMNKKLLYRKVKLLTGTSPVNLIRRVRMTKAAKLLSQDRFTVSEVMYMVGYSNPSYFSRCFVTEYNVPPSQYAVIREK